jgi:hypothetical protein
MKALTHPPNAEQDEESVEVLRAWIVDGGLEISIHPSQWEDQPDQWGRLLADATEHMADAISKETGKDRSDIYDQISEAVRHYLQQPSPNREGEFLP